MKRLSLLFIILCVLVFILGNNMGEKAGAKENKLLPATKEANAIGNVVYAYTEPDGTQRFQIPTNLPKQVIRAETLEEFDCPGDKKNRKKGESLEAFKLRWREEVIASIEEQWGDIITEASEVYKVSRPRIVGKIVIESCGNPNAISKKGAKGLMQLMDDTALEVGAKNVFDPRENIMGGTKYFRRMFDRFRSTDAAMVAYNEGPKAFRRLRHGGLIPGEHDYVRKVKVVMALSKKMNK